VSTPETQARPGAHVRRLSAALPLVSVYLWLCVVYLFEAWKRGTPWLFTDELELTQLSRSIAATGHAARRGEAHSPDSLYTYLTAPMWLIHNVASAYAGVLYLDVFVMASVVFPTYFLARMLVGRKAALFAAAGAAAIPSLAYSSYIVEETLAYPYAALCFFLIAKALVTRRRGWIAAAVVASLVAPAVRGELIVIPGLFVLAALFELWWTDRARRWRNTWSVSDWIAVVTLAFGAVFLLSGIASHQSIEWLTVTRAYKDRMVVQGNWAIGSLAIGMGVIPLIGGLAVLFRARGEEWTRELRIFRYVSLAGLIAFGLYTAMKAAWLSTVFATRVEERNLIYIAPLLFVGTAVVFERRRVSRLGLAAAGLYTLYLIGYALYHAVGSAYEMGVQLYSDALGFSILQQANRYLYMTASTARLVLLGIFLAGMLVLVAPRFLHGRDRLAGALIATLAVGLVAWNLTGEIAAAIGTVSIDRTAAKTLRHPFSWVDDATHLRPTVYVGEGEFDQNPEWMAEFWNRSIHRVTSLDGTVDGPGPAGGPDLTAKGTLLWGGAEYDYAVEDWCDSVLPHGKPWPCVDVAGKVVATHLYTAGGGTRTWKLVRLTKPNRLRAQASGIYPDGWTAADDTSYYRFSGPAGWLRVIVSRREWTGPSGPSPVHIQIGKLIVNSNAQPILGTIWKEDLLTIDSTQTKVRWLRIPAGKVAVHIIIEKKFEPHAYVPSNGDKRELGALVEYRYFFRRP
jgi:hypothetical protein